MSSPPASPEPSLGVQLNARYMAALLGLPGGVFAVSGLSVGLADQAAEASHTVKPRLPQREVLHRETYAVSERPEQITEYDAVMAAFYEAQGMEVNGTWQQHSARRIADGSAHRNRAHLKELLHERGFGLR